MDADIHCPKCRQPLTQVGAFWICPEHGQISSRSSRGSPRRSQAQAGDEAQTSPVPIAPLRIFLSYGHDANEALVRRIYSDLKERKHDVWFDQTEIKFGDDWRRAITEGITDSQKVVSFLSKHSTRIPGVCLDEIGIALGVKKGNIQTILVESEREVKPSPGVGRIQWLDMHDWKNGHGVVNADPPQEGKRPAPATGDAAWEAWYQTKLAEIIRVVESDESRRFAGEIEQLETYLKPATSDSRTYDLLKKGFTGRKWLFEAIEQWRVGDRASRVFWLTGAPGFGKSAIAAQLAVHGREVIAVEFCSWQQPDHKNPAQIIRTLAFQIATCLPDYRTFLLRLPQISELDSNPKNESDLFDYLLAEPLRHAIDGGRERHLIVIDALDEASEAGNNALVNMLAAKASLLPGWIGLVVTSRPESNVTAPLQGYKPHPFEVSSEENLADLREHLRRELATQLQHRPDAEHLVEQILEKSEGVFLYVESFCEDIRKNHLSLDRPNEFPQGLGGIYCQYFQRQFPDLEIFRKDVRPALRSILAARESLPVKVLQRLFNWQDEELRDFTRPLTSLFPVSTEAGHEVIKPYHKSLADWLADEAKAGVYFVSVNEGHRVLAEFGWQGFKTHVGDLLGYFRTHLAAHLLLAKRKADFKDLVDTGLQSGQRRMKRKKVYVIYSPGDVEVARFIQSQLSRCFSVWMDSADTGKDYESLLDGVIDDTLKSGYVLLLLSMASLQSHSCKNDVKVALQRATQSGRGNIVPIRISSFDDSLLTPDIRAMHIFDLTTGPVTERTRALVHYLRSRKME